MEELRQIKKLLFENSDCPVEQSLRGAARVGYGVSDILLTSVDKDLGFKLCIRMAKLDYELLLVDDNSTNVYECNCKILFNSKDTQICMSMISSCIHRNRKNSNIVDLYCYGIDEEFKIPISMIQ